MRPFVVAILSALLVTLIFPALAFAHAQPKTVQPGDGAVLNASPGEYVMETTQEMARREGANDLDIFDTNGNEVTAVAAVIDNSNRSRLTVTLPPTLEPGEYTVRWKTLSAEDGDPAEGELTFTIDPNATPDPGKVQLVEGAPTAPPDDGGNGESSAPPIIEGGNGGGTSWVLVAAVAVGCLVLGSGTTFLLVQKKA